MINDDEICNDGFLDSRYQTEVLEACLCMQFIALGKVTTEGCLRNPRVRVQSGVRSTMEIILLGGRVSHLDLLP